MPLSWTALLTEATLVFLLISSDHMSLESSLNERCFEIMWVLHSNKNKKPQQLHVDFSIGGLCKKCMIFTLFCILYITLNFMLPYVGAYLM